MQWLLEEEARRHRCARVRFVRRSETVEVAAEGGEMEAQVARVSVPGGLQQAEGDATVDVVALAAA